MAKPTSFCCYASTCSRKGRLLGVRAVFILAAAVAQLTCPYAGAQERPAWWSGAWRYRELLRLSDQGQRSEGAAAKVWLHIRSGADHGGRDIRVIDPKGQQVHFGIVHGTSDGAYLLVFQITEPTGLYAVYYGNPDASAVGQRLPARGLVYETRPVPDDAKTDSWPAARQTIRRAGSRYGADYWPRIFDAYNPFGPQPEYIAIYRGHIYCPREGTYGFAPVSDGPSFLLVDGVLVAQCPPDRVSEACLGKFGSEIELKEGTHRFFYVHFVSNGRGRTAVAWRPPQEELWTIMPEGAFPALVQAEVVGCEQNGASVCADFTYRPERYCEAGEARMVLVQFVSTSTSARGQIEQYEWHFGDGQVARDPQPKHVFLDLGRYAVMLKVTTSDGRQAYCTKQVRVQPIWNDLDFGQQKLDGFFEWIRQYRLELLPTPSLLAAWKFLKHIEKEQETFAAARALDGRRGQLEADQLHELAMDLGTYYQMRERRYYLAEQYFELARDSIPEGGDPRRLNARLALADLHLRGMDDPERARREYVELRADFPQADPELRRRALIGIGDTYRSQGDVEGALQAYQEAAGGTEPKALVRGAAFHSVEAYLREGQGESARQELDGLLWSYPTVRLEGRPALLAVKIALLQGDFEEARKQADLYIGFARDPNYLPAIHIAAADACIELGLVEEAERHYHAVLDGFPESAETQSAASGLQSLSK